MCQELIVQGKQLIKNVVSGNAACLKACPGTEVQAPLLLFWPNERLCYMPTTGHFSTDSTLPINSASPLKVP